MAHPAGNGPPDAGNRPANTNVATRRKRACEQFYKGAEHNETKHWLPTTITPFAISDISVEDKNTLLKAIKEVNPDTMLILVLGEANQIIHASKNASITNKLLDEHHKVFDTDFVREFSGPKTVLVIDPGHNLPDGVKIQNYDIDRRLIEKNVVSIRLVKSEFPLTPVFGPHKHFYGPHSGKMFTPNLKPTTVSPEINRSVKYYRDLSPENQETIRKSMMLEGHPKELNEKVKKNPYSYLALRRKIYKQGIDVLEALVAYRGPLVISSRIKDICYRSFKYLLDRRAASPSPRPTKAFYGQTGYAPEECVSAEEYPLFPHPFAQCKDWYTSTEVVDEHLDTYYSLMNMKSNSQKERRRSAMLPTIRARNAWANELLAAEISRERVSEPRAGGKRKTRKRKPRKG